MTCDTELWPFKQMKSQRRGFVHKKLVIKINSSKIQRKMNSFLCLWSTDVVSSLWPEFWKKILFWIKMLRWQIYTSINLCLHLCWWEYKIYAFPVFQALPVTLAPSQQAGMYRWAVFNILSSKPANYPTYLWFIPGFTASIWPLI